MKKGILISGIITIVTYSIVALVFLSVAVINLVAKDMAETDPGAIPPEELGVAIAAFFVVAGCFALGVVFAGILIGKRNSGMGKGAGITLGVFGIIFGAIVPAIFFLVDSAQSRG